MRVSLLCFIALLLLVACDRKESPPELKLVAVKLEDLPGFNGDDLSGVRHAFERSCSKILSWPDDRKLNKQSVFGKASDWKPVCRALEGYDGDFSFFITSQFKAFSVRNHKDADGFFTGYYEPVLQGSREKTDQYSIPLYKRPKDLIEVNLGDFKAEFVGKKIVGRIDKNRLVPYYTHEEIDRKPLANEDVLVWVKNKVDSVFLQIQGSGIVRFEDGNIMRVGYAAQNGCPYHSIGKTLLNWGALEPGKVSMQSIKVWLETHPDRMMEALWSNPSYVFFRKLDTTSVGSLGVELTPLRSLAVDRQFIPLGVPLWVDIEMPEGYEAMRRLMFAQDTGGAIKGVVRADVFFGAGEKAAELAGHMQQKGQYYVLLPNALAERVK